MTTFFLYLMKSVLCLALFYPFYMVLLSRETFHRFNRMALISILLASVVIPACRITTEEPMLLSQLYQRWEHWLTGQEVETATAVAYADWADVEFATMSLADDDTLAVAPAFSLGDFLSEHWGDLLFLLYVAGILFLIGRHIASLVRLFGLLKRGQMQRLDDGTCLYLHQQTDIAPFSWMKYIVISEADYRENGRQIVAHEQAHISNHHSWDLLLVEVCLLAQWFNPAAWLLRQELQNIHEYEADDTVLRRGINAREYQLLIIKKAVGARLYSLANSLNHSSLKKRLTMMMKEKSHPWARLKYLYVLPLAAISMVAFAHTEAANNSNGISEAKGTEVLANNQIPGVKSSENEKVLIVVDGKLTIQETEPIDWTNEDLAKHIGVTPEEIAQIEVIKKPEILAQWNIPGATGAILVTTKKAKAADETAEAAKEKFTVTINNAGEYSYGRMGGTLTKGSLDDVANYIQTERRKLTEAGGGQYLAVNVKLDNNAPKESFEKLKNTLRKAWVMRITYGLLEDENPVVVVHVNDKGEYSYGYKGETMEEASLERITNFIEAVQLDRIDKQKEGPLLRVSLSVDKNAPAESVEKLKVAIRESHISKLEYNMASEQKEALIDYLKLNGQPRLNEESNAIEWGSAEEVFMVVENMPEFPGGTAELMKFLAKNIKYPAEAQQKGEQGRVMVQFVVGKDGKLSDIKIMRSISPALDAEAIRVIKAMPTWKPGTQRGQAVAVKYTIPISFRLQGSKGDDKPVASDIQVVSVTKANNENSKPIPTDPVKDSNGEEVFMVVEKMPEFPGGTAELMKFLQQNIKYPEQARKDSIQGRVIVQFVITKTGKVSNATVIRSVSPELDAEAIRVINAMPLWTPGEQKGEPVNVKFTLPIQFRLVSGKGKSTQFTAVVNGKTIVVESQPTTRARYAEGREAMLSFFQSRLKFDKSLSDKVEEHVLLQAFISPEGKLIGYNDITRKNNLETPDALIQEAHRVADLLPKEGWVPAVLNGKPVNGSVAIPVSFRFKGIPQKGV